jgi:hypothetical protein
MPTTTNFGWTTPADTDLVKDGAAAIRTLAGNIDTSLVDLKGGTSGQYLTKNSNTDLDFAFVTLSAGGMTLLTTHTLSGATSTISSIDQTYKQLYGVIYGVTNATADGTFSLRCNGSTSEHVLVRYSTAGVQGLNANVFFLMNNTTGAMTRTDANNAFTFTIDNYASSTNYKTITSHGLYTSGSYQAWSAGGYYANTAVTSLVFANSGGNLSTGTVLLYGVK